MLIFLLFDGIQSLALLPQEIPTKQGQHFSQRQPSSDWFLSFSLCSDTLHSAKIFAWIFCSLSKEAGATRATSAQSLPSLQRPWAMQRQCGHQPEPAHPTALSCPSPLCCHYHSLSTAAKAGVDLGQDLLGAESSCSFLKEGKGSGEVPSLQLLQP